ncbi:MAG TPA: PQQ-binding-like beta-propeller repeat protein [Ktedonobacteraceae bacterium]|nr:PQQ-binding-like beta-propeller repeat protein [Ktedonobacteraceae bacterium]
MKQKLICGICLILVALVVGVTLVLQHMPVPAHGDTNSDWASYLNNGARTGTNLNETAITAATASQLQLAWTFSTGGKIAAEPILANGVLYIGSWDGYEYAVNVATHALLWKQFLGIAQPPEQCYFKNGIGITSTATVEDGVVYVGGGDGNMYALHASDGSVIWKTMLGTFPYYNWSSPLVYNNELYIGLASYCPPPQVQGKVMALHISDGSVAATLSLVHNGQTGAAVWSSPAVDVASNTIYITTGNNQSHRLSQQKNAESILALDPSTLAIKDQWQIPQTEKVKDGDFGATPTLFDLNGMHYIGVLNKNGIYYMLDRTNLAAGPIWQQKLSFSSGQVKGDNVSPSCYANGVVYTGSGGGIGKGNQVYGGTVGAFAAATGAQLWYFTTPGKMFAAVTCTNDLVVDNEGNTVEVRAAATGSVLFSYTTGGQLDGASAISNGVLYTPSTDGHVYAFAVPS